MSWLDFTLRASLIPAALPHLGDTPQTIATFQFFKYQVPNTKFFPTGLLRMHSHGLERFPHLSSFCLFLLIIQGPA